MTFSLEIEPMVPSMAAMSRSILPELALDLERKAAALSGMMNPVTQAVLEEHIRVVNSYYSNLIEGNTTHMREIRQAMAGNYSNDPVKRDLQIESLAHIDIQRLLFSRPISVEQVLDHDFLRRIHKVFFERLPESLRLVQYDDGRKILIQPGEFRRLGEEVDVGVHLAPQPEDINRLPGQLQEAYRPARHRGGDMVIAIMAAHHRLTWIHPFLDGNGRIDRLHTDLLLKAIGVGASGIWCLSRGLARADQPKQGRVDGHGALSEWALIEFCECMLRTSIDQVEYWRKPHALTSRRWHCSLVLAEGAKALLQHGLHRRGRRTSCAHGPRLEPVRE